MCERQVGTGGAVETHHLHARWQKARALAKLRDVPVSAVGWDAEAAGDDTTGCGRHSILSHEAWAGIRSRASCASQHRSAWL